MLTPVIKGLFANDIFQRSVYSIGLITWTFLNWHSLGDGVSRFHITHWTVYLIPAIILVLQIIRNNKILWGVIFGLFTIVTLSLLFNFIYDSVILSGFHMKAIEWTYDEIIYVIGFFGFLGIADWIIYQLKPTRLL